MPLVDLELTGFGGDLVFNPNGDLAILQDLPLIQQQILLTLMTSPGGDVFNIEFGVGVGLYVGRVSSDFEGLDTYIQNELKVIPEITNVAVTFNQSNSTMYCLIEFTYVETNQTGQVVIPLVTP